MTNSNFDDWLRLSHLLALRKAGVRTPELDEHIFVVSCVVLGLSLAGFYRMLDSQWWWA